MSPRCLFIVHCLLKDLNIFLLVCKSVQEALLLIMLVGNLVGLLLVLAWLVWHRELLAVALQDLGVVELLLDSAAVDLSHFLVLLETLVHQVAWRMGGVLETLVVLGHIQSLTLRQVDVGVGCWLWLPCGVAVAA